MLAGGFHARVLKDGELPCGECLMLVKPGEYHPYAACLMFKACHDSRIVRENLAAVLEHGKIPHIKVEV